MHLTGKKCDVAPYTDGYKTIKAVPIVQAFMEYNNPETRDTTILIFKKYIWMSATMDHTVVNPNKLHA